MPDVLVGLDVGTTGVKGVAISPDGEVLATADEQYPLSTPQPGWAEQDPEDWWRAAQACLARLPEGPIGLSGQMHGLVVLDGGDRVLRPAILWNDQRTAAECAEIERRVGLERLIELTGNRALTGFTAPKLLWLRTHEPETYARIEHVLLPKDYVRFRLTGEHAIDVADASGTLLFDVADRRWSTEVCAALEIPLEWLPPAHESTEIAGAGDQAAAALGVGIDAPGPVSVVLGTSGVVFAVLPAYAPDAEARVHVFCHAVPGTWHAMGVMLSAAGSAAWLRHVLGARLRDARRRGGRAGRPAPRGSSSRRTSRASARRTPIRTRAAPSPASTLRHDRGALWRAMLEGVAYGLRDSLELLRALGVEPERRARLGRRRAQRRSGCGSSPRCSASRSSAPRPRRARRSAPPCSPASAQGAFADAHEAVARCVRVRERIEPDPAGVTPTTTATSATGCSTPPSATSRRPDEPGRQDGSDHRREPRHRRRGRADAPRARREPRARLAERRRPRSRTRGRAARATCATSTR